MNQEEVKQLLEKYRTGHCSEREQQMLYSWYLDQAEQPNVLSQREVEAAERHIWGALHKHIQTEQVKGVKKLWPGIAAAASVIVLLGAAIFFFTSKYVYSPVTEKHIAYDNDVAPGKNTATLTLANGETIKLSDTKTGIVINTGALTYVDGSALQKDDHQLLNAAEKRMEGMTVATPRGGTYQVILPDGTKVWLNAASSLQFPSGFGKSAIRKVQLSGEAYFEVAKNEGRRFVVATGKQEVEVLGTHFNINSYVDEPEIKTTLLEGSVRVSTQNIGHEPLAAVVLKPGEQSVLRKNIIEVNKIDTEEAIAWKNGYFLYNEEPISSIMRKIDRWYDVEVVYVGDVKHLKFAGTVSRFKNVSEILRKFELTQNVHFKIEGRRITVMP